MGLKQQPKCKVRTCQFCTGKYCTILKQKPDDECPFRKERKSKAEQEKDSGVAADPLRDRRLRTGWMMRIKQFGKQETATILERKGVKYGKQ